MRQLMHTSLLTVVLMFCISSTASSAIIFSDDFSYSDSPLNHGWSEVGSAAENTDTGCRSGRCLKITYTVEGTTPYIFSRSESTPLQEAYYSFSFKLVNPYTCGGMKFLKLRAYTSSSNYANVTTQLQYSTSNLYQTDYGCGSTDENDQNCGGPWGTSTLWGVGTIVNEGSIYTFSDENWHTYEAYIKYNSDSTEDGAYTIWIDGIVHREVTGVVMRSDNNLSGANIILLGDYFRADGCEFTSAELYYDDFVISSERIGGTDIGTGTTWQINDSGTSVTIQ